MVMNEVRFEKEGDFIFVGEEILGFDDNIL